MTTQILKAAGYNNILVTASERSFPSLRPYASHLISYSSLPDAIRTIKSFIPVNEPLMVIDCIGDQMNTVEPIAEIVKGRKGSKVAVMLPVRRGGYGKTEGVDMEVKIDFGDGVEILGVRTHFYEKVSAYQFSHIVILTEATSSRTRSSRIYFNLRSCQRGLSRGVSNPSHTARSRERLSSSDVKGLCRRSGKGRLGVKS